ncbi:hypothetical protein OEB96_02715 [Paraliomyxa miuraensis]|nr:hypothetical protein [Paraliomyxa miuraensis]
MARARCWWWPWWLLWLVGCGAGPSTEPHGEAVVVAEIDLLGAPTRIRETLVWQGGRGPHGRELQLEPIPGAFPLRPELVLEHAAIDDAPIEVGVRHYDDWLDLDLPNTPGEGRHRLDLAYTLHGAWRAGDDGVDVLRMQQVGPRSPLTIRNVTLRVLAPPDAALGLWVANGYGAYDRVELQRQGEVTEGAQAWVASLGSSPPATPLYWQLGVRSPSFDPAPLPYLVTLVGQSGSVPWALAGMVLLALVLRGQPPHRVIAGTRVLHLAMLAVAAWELVGQQLRSWWGALAVPSSELGTALVEIAASLGLFVILGQFLREQDRGLTQRRPESYELELALPLTLALAVPMMSVRTSYLLLPLLGVPGLVAWLRRPIALAMGVDLHLVVEAVRTRGTTTVPELAAAVGLRPEALRELLQRHPELPVVFERREDRVLSTSTATLRDDLRLCPSCGGATRITGQDLLACPYCEREYASVHVPSSSSPVPLVVRSTATYLDLLGRGLMAWAVLLGAAFLAMALLGNARISVVGALVGGAVLLLVAHGAHVLLGRFAHGLRAGKGYRVLLVLLGLGVPLVVPAILLWRLRSPRARLHFGRFDLQALDRYLGERGQLSLDELAQRLGTRWDEAFDLAVYLCGNGGLDAVLDRVGLRLIARARLRELATAGTCLRCGGILGIGAGTVRCHHCGTTANAA